MKRGLLKTISAVIALVVIISLFAGCGGQRAAEKEETTAKSDAGTAGTEAKTEANVTFENAPVVRIMRPDITSPQRAEAKLDEIDNPYSRYIFEKTGLRVELDRQPDDGYQEKVQLVLASGNAPDIIDLTYEDGYAMNIARSGALEPLNPHFDKYPNLKRVYNEEYWEEYAFDENKYFLKSVDYWPLGRSAVLIRQDWLDKLGLKMPETVQELYNVAKAFVQAEPDGQKTFGLMGRKDLTHFFALSSAFGCPSTSPQFPYIYVDKATKQLVCWQTSEAGRAYFKEVAKWWKEGLIDPESLTNTGDQFWGKINNGQIGIICHQAESSAWVTTQIRQTQKRKEPLLTLVPALKGTGYKNPYGTEGGFEKKKPYDLYFGVPKGNKNVDNVLKLFDFQCSPEFVDYVIFGIEGIEHNVVDGKKVLDKMNVNKVSFSNDYALTVDRSALKPEHHETVLLDASGGGDPELDPLEDAMERVKNAFATSETYATDYQKWASMLPRLPEEDLHPDVLQAMRSLYIRLVTAELDANKDADWEKYLKEVESIGFNQILKAKEKYLLENLPRFFE